MNTQSLENELLKFGYTERISDLIKYSGSFEALVWYWETYLGKALRKSKKFYNGGFIRIKVRKEAFEKYQEYCKLSNHSQNYAINEKHKLHDLRKRQKQFAETLEKWFSDYEKQTDKEIQFDDIRNFIEYSGYFDYMDSIDKDNLLSLESPVYMNSVHRRLFYDYRNSLNTY